MKIYGSQNYTDLNQFAGSDLWVRMNYGDVVDVYCKIYKIYPEVIDDKSYEFIAFMSINARIVDLTSKEHISNQDLMTINHYIDYAKDAVESGSSRYATAWELGNFQTMHTIITPIDVLTNEEVMDAIDEAIKRCEPYL